MVWLNVVISFALIEKVRKLRVSVLCHSHDIHHSFVAILFLILETLQQIYNIFTVKCIQENE